MDVLKVRVREYRETKLWTAVQKILQNGFVKHHRHRRYTWMERWSLVRKLKRCYTATSKTERGDVLIPFNAKTFKSIEEKTFDPGGQNINEYILEYRWNEWKKGEGESSHSLYAEFQQGRYQVGTVIPEGTMFDRVGSIDGSYLCPVPSERDVFSVQERAIPYLFLEDRISVEPSYHKYVATCEISKQSLAQKMAEKPGIFSDDPNVLKYVNKISNLEIIEGYIAAVKSFGAQGVGGGYQYKMPLPIRHLLMLEVIKEV